MMRAWSRRTAAPRCTDPAAPAALVASCLTSAKKERTSRHLATVVAPAGRPSTNAPATGSKMSGSPTSETPSRNATAVVVGAGDFIGGEIAKRFAAEGYTVFIGRRQAEKLEPLRAEIEAAGGR